MRSHLRLVALAAALAAVACLFWPRRVAGCGPMAVELALNYNPALPKDCADIGVLPGNYSYRGLYIAYRCIEGLPLSPGHRQSLDTSLHGDEVWGESAAHGAWLAARDKMPNPPAHVERYRQTEGSFSEYLNCSDDAFRTALGTSQERMARFGPDSKDFAAWLEGQDRVFANCQEGPAVIPDPLPESFDPLLRADRKYQIAAAHFYAGHFEVAEALFLEIGKDASSPWRQFGPYLSARCLIRRATLGSGESGPDAKVLAQADARLRSVLQDPGMSRVHASARGLLQFIHLRLQPFDSARELGAALAKRDLDADFPQQFVDYLYSLRVAEVKGEDDFDEWISWSRYGDPGAPLDRWKQIHSPAWLATALARAQYGKPGWQEALSASSAVGPNSPAFPTVAFHRIRLELEARKIQLARAELDRLLSGKAHRFPRPVMNLFRAERMKVARSLDEFLRDAPRTPVQGGGDVFDDDAAAALTEWTPLAVLAKAAASPRLPPNLRWEVAQAAWVRAVLLDDDETAQAVAQASTAFGPHLGEYLKEKDANGRRSAALLTLLRLPGLHPHITSGQTREQAVAVIDSYRNNWWCESNPDSSSTEHWEEQIRILYPAGKASPPRFLTDAEKRAAAQEREKLAALPTAPNYLSAAAIAWAKRSPDDPRVPEALHSAVRTTRYGCVDELSGPLSKEAFRLLHSRYPNSKWTRKTPYWFSGR